MNLSIIINHTKQVVAAVKSLDLFSGGVHFESPPRRRLYQMRFSRDFALFLQKNAVVVFRPWLLPSKSLPNYQSYSSRRCVNWITDRVIKHATTNNQAVFKRCFTQVSFNRQARTEVTNTNPKKHLINNKANNVRVNVTLRRVRETTVTVENNKCCVFWVCVYSLIYPACNAHEPYCIVIWGLSDCTVSFHIIS